MHGVGHLPLDVDPGLGGVLVDLQPVGGRLPLQRRATLELVVGLERDLALVLRGREGQLFLERRDLGDVVLLKRDLLLERIDLALVLARVDVLQQPRLLLVADLPDLGARGDELPLAAVALLQDAQAVLDLAAGERGRLVRLLLVRLRDPGLRFLDGLRLRPLQGLDARLVLDDDVVARRGAVPVRRELLRFLAPDGFDGVRGLDLRDGRRGRFHAARQRRESDLLAGRE